MTVVDQMDRLVKLAELRRKVEAEIIEILTRQERVARLRRSRFEVPPCGTETGYQRHRYRGEDCEPCKVAHRIHNRQQEHRRRQTKGRI